MCKQTLSSLVTRRVLITGTNLEIDVTNSYELYYDSRGRSPSASSDDDNDQHSADEDQLDEMYPTLHNQISYAADTSTSDIEDEVYHFN
ncbi:hypothetical protein INT47_002161 [Mucor saturninus]|uniref:Uncharacterized protein n=1 Tax=Mucor saturninus TaxID=64648 RepID=A0A8H7R1R1_9FUNG|nr:hypothetical protein INT47_002161 [Mucor saturninus]